MRSKIGTILGGIVILFLTTNASCPIDPCKLITCQPGFHCENGTCVPDTPVDPCEGITCTPFHKCIEGQCIGNCEGYNCQTGFHCEVIDNDPTCVKDPPWDPCQGVVCDTGYHCEKGNCIPDNPPPTDPCPKDLAEGSIIYMNNKAYGNGFD